MERNTKQKDVLISYLKNNSNQHLTINKIKDDLENSLGLTTIYRIINSLVEKGNVLKVSMENGQGYCYQYNNKEEKCDDHYHLICEKCNKLIHYENSDISRIEEEIKEDKNFTVDRKRIVFYGICKECKDK